MKHTTIMGWYVNKQTNPTVSEEPYKWTTIASSMDNLAMERDMDIVDQSIDMANV